MKTLQILFIFIVLLSSCKKDEVIVPGNNPPADPTITNTVIENYIHKVYISLLGREPDSTEIANGLNILRVHNLSAADRSLLLDQILADTAYFSHQFQITNADLLNDMDTAEVTQFITIFNILLADSTNLPFFSVLNYEKNRLIDFQQTSDDYINGNVPLVDLQKVFIDNYFYDQINMGTLNFVVSMYQHFFTRYPSVNELNAGISMVDGNIAIAFLQTGSSKQDFINIFFSSNDYYEGQVRSLYLRYLLREPTSNELSDFTLQFASDKNFKALQKKILMLDEFVFL